MPEEHMKRQFIWIAVVSIGLITACSARRDHRDAYDDLLCQPSDVHLSVASELIDIKCKHSDDHAGMFDCEVVRFDDSSKSHNGLFRFRNDISPTSFDPADESNYGSWDNCTIYLRDGRSLEEIEIISSGAGSPTDFE